MLVAILRFALNDGFGVGWPAVFTVWGLSKATFVVFARERSERGNRMMLKGMIFCFLALYASLMLVAILRFARMTGLGYMVFAYAGWFGLLRRFASRNEVILLTTF